MGHACVDTGGDEHSLTRQRNSKALDAYESEDCQVAVGREGVVEIDRGEGV